MSYSFDYDPESGETPWPMVWTVVPASYNWVGTIGDNINFITKAVPDPEYPDAWNDHYSTGSDGGGIGGGGTTAPSLPPEPEIVEYIYESSSTMDEVYVTSSLTNGIIIDNVDSELFFPYESIVYFKDNIRKEAQFPQEAIDDDFDYISALVPDRREFIVRTANVTAVSTSTEDLYGSFQFRINNDWDKARNTLETMSVQSKSYFDDLTAGTGDGPEPVSPPNDNTANDTPLEVDLPDTSDEESSFVEEHEQSYDELFREGDQSKINTIISNDPDFYENLKEETETVSVTEDSELGTSESPIDKAIREGNIAELMDKYGYSYAEVIELIRGI